MCGNFNVPNVDWATLSPTSFSGPADRLCTIVLDSSLFQHVNSPTRDNNILDLVFSNRDYISSVDVVDNLPSTDHLAVEFQLSVSIPVQRQCQRSLYNYKKADFDTFCVILSHIPWTCVIDCSDIEYSWSLLKDLFFAAVGECVPLVRWKRRKMKHWSISFIHKKRQLYLLKKKKPNSTVAAAKYRRISNIVRHLTRHDTREHAIKICSFDYTKNPNKFWSWVNASKAYREPIPTLNYEGSVISDDTAKASCFNNYFSSVFTREDTISLSDLRSTIVQDLDLITTIHFTPNDVLDELTSLNVSKACGPDFIPARLLKEGAESICTSLAHLF